ncbi:MAG: hypothetical protein KDH96_03645 [Candidatus Riesia sp.]|nr:hypothetical protein [Candidatus Riesia sp.]
MINFIVRNKAVIHSRYYSSNPYLRILVNNGKIINWNSGRWSTYSESTFLSYPIVKIGGNVLKYLVL